MIEDRIQATLRILKLHFRHQNFNVRFADFEQLHVTRIVGKVVRDRDHLIFLEIRLHHLNINDNARSTQV